MTSLHDFNRQILDLADARGITLTRIDMWGSGGIEFIWGGLQLTAAPMEQSAGDGLLNLLRLFPVKEPKA